MVTAVVTRKLKCAAAAAAECVYVSSCQVNPGGSKLYVESRDSVYFESFKNSLLSRSVLQECNVVLILINSSSSSSSLSPEHKQQPRQEYAVRYNISKKMTRSEDRKAKMSQLISIHK